MEHHTEHHIYSPEPDVEVEVIVRIRDGESHHRLCFHETRTRHPLDDPRPDTVVAFSTAAGSALADATEFITRAYPERRP